MKKVSEKEGSITEIKTKEKALNYKLNREEIT